jgi:alpha-1,6-mannosyltransferase
MALQRTATTRWASAPAHTWSRAAANVGLLALLAASAVLAVDAAAGPSPLVPAGRRAFPGWLAGPFRAVGDPTTTDGLGVLLVVMLVAWLLVMTGARELAPRRLVIAIVTAHLIFLLAPPLLSADVFGYIGFARLGAVHHLNPYVFGTAWAPDDPVQPFLRWRDAHSPYGPLFTLGSYAVVPLGVAGAFWAFKALAFAVSLATVALVWRIATRLGRDPRPAAVLVGLNPPLLAFEVGGGHNDALVVVLALAGIGLVLERREATGLGAIVLAATLKASAGIVAPFALVGARDRRGAMAGAAVAAAAVAMLAVIGFGIHAGLSVTAAARSGGRVAVHSVPSAVARLLGADAVSPLARTLLGLAVLVCVAGLLVGAARGADWIACAGWATLALLCGSTWLLPWYLTWLAPLAALGDSRRLRVATVLFVTYVTLTRVPFVPL